MAINPATLMIAATLVSIEKDLVQIKDLNKKILSFLEEEKESEIESDLEILNRSITDFKYNSEDKSYLANNHKQVMDIKRTANKNILFYKKQIKDILLKNNIYTTKNKMKSILLDIEKKFKYYRLSLYIYSFASLIEILLLENYNSDYLVSKRNELNSLEIEYINNFDEALIYIKENANKSLEGNIISGLGNAGKVIGTLAEKVNVKNIDIWVNEKSDSLKQIGQDIKDTYSYEFVELKESNSKIFMNQIDKIDYIFNKTKQIYFDKDNIYFDAE